MAETYGQLPQTYIVWGTEGTYGTAATTIANWELWQNVNIEESHNILPARGLGSRQVQKLVTGATDGKLTGELLIQDMKMLCVLGGFSDSTSGTAGDTTHTMSISTSATLPSGTVEIGHDGTADTIYKATGLKINSWTIHATTEDMAKVTLDCIYQDIDATDTTAQSPSLKTTIPFAIAELSVEIDDTPLVECNNFSMTVNNNFAAVRGLGAATIQELKPGAFDVTFTCNANMRDTAYQQYMAGNDEIKVALKLTESATRSIVFTLANCRVGRWSESQDVGGGIVNCTIEGQSYVTSMAIVEHNQIATAYA